jgi:hypothetical protein
MNYVYETLGKHGNDVMGDYHLLSHFHCSDLANPIQPVHADDSVRDCLGVMKEHSHTGPACNQYVPGPETVLHSIKHSANGHTRKRQQQQVQSIAV